MNSHHPFSGKEKALGRLAPVLLCVFILGSGGCSNTRDPAMAPAYGSVGGMMIGGLAGAAAGDVGIGMFAGGILGQGAGVASANETVRQDWAHTRHLPSLIKAGKDFDAKLVKEYRSLTKVGSTGGIVDVRVLRSRKQQIIKEASSWIRLLERTDSAIGREIGRETGYPVGNLRSILQDRTKLRNLISSIKLHRSWCESLPY